jgi:hypothetical protein
VSTRIDQGPAEQLLDRNLIHVSIIHPAGGSPDEAGALDGQASWQRTVGVTVCERRCRPVSCERVDAEDSAHPSGCGHQDCLGVES